MPGGFRTPPFVCVDNDIALFRKVDFDHIWNCKDYAYRTLAGRPLRSRVCTGVVLMSTYARTASGRYRGSLYSDEQTDRGQQASVPVVLDDSNVHASTDDVESRPHTAESAPAISSKSPAIVDKSSVNPAQNMDTGDITPAHSQPVPSHDDPAASLQGGAAKTPPRHLHSALATSHTHGQSQARSQNNHGHSFSQRRQQYPGQPNRPRILWSVAGGPSATHGKDQSRQRSRS